MRSVIKMGNKTEDGLSYSNRTSSTIAPFLDLNHEAVGFVRRMLEEKMGINDLSLSQEEIEQTKKEDNPKKTRKK